MGRMMDRWQLHRGDSPLVIDVPHSGTHLPDALRPRLTGIGQTVPDTDWHVDRLYQFATTEGATLLCATQSRYVVDLNRDPSGAALYAGADNTELCPTRTFGGEAIYVDGDAPSSTEVADRCATSFAPYHAVLAAELARVRERYGFAVLLDGHSIRAEVPRFFAGRLPDLNLGTASGASCAPQLQAAATRVLLESEGFTHIVNGRFKGGWVTRHYGQPQHGVHALQLEMAQDCYMDEAPPYRWDPARASRLGTVLQRLVHALSTFRPPA
jgi:N-formylglutamate amidohydrolase